MSTKQGNVKFREIARDNVTLALIASFVAAFGADLTDLAAVLLWAFENNDQQFLLLCLAAGVQIRGNVNFVVPANIPTLQQFKELMVIEGRGNLPDTLNFGGLHVLGHLWAAISPGVYSRKISDKAGNCVDGDKFPESVAGKVNKELRDKWPVSAPQEAVAMFQGKKVLQIDDVVKHYKTQFDASAYGPAGKKAAEGGKKKRSEGSSSAAGAGAAAKE